MPIQWSEERPPNKECSYDHVVAETPLGQLFIEWKGWKDYPSPTCELPWGEMTFGNTVEDAKKEVQVAWNSMVLAVSQLVSKEVENSSVEAGKKG